MNRRELAKNGFLGLYGALLGKKVHPEPAMETWMKDCKDNEYYRVSIPLVCRGEEHE